MRTRVLALLCAAAVAAAPIPAPVVVDEPGGLPEGLTLGPGVARVEAATDGALVTHHLAVGSGGRVVFDLGAREVEPDAEGAPTLGGPTDALRLPAGEVTLDPGERATVTSVVEGPGDGSRLVALTATPRGGGETLVAFVVAAAPGTPDAGAPDVQVSLDGERLTVGLPATGGAHAVSDLRVRLAPLVGSAVVDDTLLDVLRWPDRDRELVWQLDLPPWPVPYRVEAVAGEAGGEVARAETTAWPPLGAWLPGVAVVLLVVTALALLLVRRRARRAGERPTGNGA